MHWYNPKRRVAESVLAPYTDEEAEHMLFGALPTRGPSLGSTKGSGTMGWA